MYNYSPIKSLKLKNFRNMANVELDFTESPIVTLVGKNESGKTSVIKAFETCALHASPREQKDWIRDQTNMFGIEIDLEDGTKVIRIKESGGINMYKVEYPNGNHWEVSKLTEGLPHEVQKIMGLIEEPETKEYLHVRTYEDKLLFVVTPNSTNYKVMYNALKVEQLTKAIKIGSAEINELKADINKNDISITTLHTQLRGIHIRDLGSLIMIRDRIKEQLKTLKKLEKIMEVHRHVENLRSQLGAIAVLERFNLQPINELLASRLLQAGTGIENISRLREKSQLLDGLLGIEEIDTSVYSRLRSMLEKKADLEQKINEAGSYVEIGKINEVSEASAIHLNKVYELINRRNNLEAQQSILNKVSSLSEITNTEAVTKLSRIMELNNQIATEKDQYNKIVDYIEQVEVYLKQCGVAVETCPRCGEAVIFDIDKLEG